MKRNIREDFEYIYLRFNTVKRDIAKADHSILTDAEFKRTVRFAAGKSFSVNHGLYESNGFSFEDVLSITTLFGLAFCGNTSDQTFPTSKDKNNLMIHYINQRLNKFCEWIVKKFSVDDAIVHSIEGAGERLSNKSDNGSNIDYMDLFSADQKYGIRVGEVNMWGQEDDDLPPILDQIEEHEELLENTKKALQQERESKNEKGVISARNKKKRLEAELRELRQTYREDSSFHKDLTKELKQRLASDPEKFQELLAYYATTKHVSKDIRKAARAYCKKYAIDYVSWLKAKIESENFDRTEFSF